MNKDDYKVNGVPCATLDFFNDTIDEINANTKKIKNLPEDGEIMRRYSLDRLANGSYTNIVGNETSLFGTWGAYLCIYTLLDASSEYAGSGQAFVSTNKDKLFTLGYELKDRDNIGININTSRTAIQFKNLSGFSRNLRMQIIKIA